MNKVLMLIATTLLAVTLAPSCQKMDKTTRPDSVTLYLHSQPDKPESAAAGTKGVTIAATCDWTVRSEEDWVTVSPQSGPEGIHEVVLTYSENTGTSSRAAAIVFTARGGQSETYVLTQNPKE